MERDVFSDGVNPTVVVKRRENRSKTAVDSLKFRWIKERIVSQKDRKKTETAVQDETRMLDGANIIVQALINCGVKYVFGYPGGATIPLHQAFTHYRDKIRVILPRHEQA